ncbi:MAG TPA: TDP-N-acetylfucosamine:lipid II N-acetylfucosaminyltransferase [Agriterribacter sp.]|nr:TDP-N-acetylfucosamine:lipid II N-acetylfucosaminyltransferase [Agriterribacter sp.]
MEIKILHILNDDKFIDRHISNIQKGDFQNTFVYLKEEFTYTGSSLQLLKHVKPYSLAFDDLINDCQNYHVLILYYLSKDKADIVNKLKKKKPIIIWSFYGGDLYSLPEIKTGLFSPGTLNVLNISTKKTPFLYIKDFLCPLYKIFSKNSASIAAIRKAISRIDYFAWYNKEEYEFLNERFKNKLPVFLKSSIATPFNLIHGTSEKLGSILIGNSASPYNNHIDIIQELDKLNYSGKITIPFSYGSQHYITRIKELVKSSKLHISFLESFFPYQDYISLMNEHTCAIFNSYRQMALGNIFIALKCGVKVYLSSKNPSYQWLKKKGFFIYSIENDLTRHVKENNLRLSEEYAKLNIFTCNKIGDGNANKRFLYELKRIVEEHTTIH